MDNIPRHIITIMIVVIFSYLYNKEDLDEVLYFLIGILCGAVVVYIFQQEIVRDAYGHN